MIEFLLARGERAMPLQTLRRMASGGIYDQVGGGFARYSVDARWLVPHFEKMLYDNALLARAYLHAYQVTGEPLFRRVCEETLDWAMRELRQDEGGFASSLDADSEGVEGKFYVWTPDEIRAALGDDLGRRRDRALRRDRGRQLRGREHPRARDVGPAGAAPRSRRGCWRRARRACGPALDDKRLTSWNALMISALADAGAALERADYLAAAVACASLRRDRAARRRRAAAAHVQPRPREAPGLPRGPRLPARGLPRRSTRPRSTSAGSSAPWSSPRRS